MLSTNAVKVYVGDDALIKCWGGKQEIAARLKMAKQLGLLFSI
ncbi:MAG: hypothetical protein ACJAV1_003509 [Paraglaciecola sp.]|jgi:hypothetical protein